MAPPVDTLKLVQRAIALEYNGVDYVNLNKLCVDLAVAAYDYKELDAVRKAVVILLGDEESGQLPILHAIQGHLYMVSLTGDDLRALDHLRRAEQSYANLLATKMRVGFEDTRIPKLGKQIARYRAYFDNVRPLAAAAGSSITDGVLQAETIPTYTPAFYPSTVSRDPSSVLALSRMLTQTTDAGAPEARPHATLRRTGGFHAVNDMRARSPNSSRPSTSGTDRGRIAAEPIGTIEAMMSGALPGGQHGGTAPSPEMGKPATSVERSTSNPVNPARTPEAGNIPAQQLPSKNEGLPGMDAEKQKSRVSYPAPTPSTTAQIRTGPPIHSSGGSALPPIASSIATQSTISRNVGGIGEGSAIGSLLHVSKSPPTTTAVAESTAANVPEPVQQTLPQTDTALSDSAQTSSALPSPQISAGPETSKPASKVKKSLRKMLGKKEDKEAHERQSGGLGRSNSRMSILGFDWADKKPQGGDGGDKDKDKGKQKDDPKDGDEGDKYFGALML
ncbi:hypothetical protein LTR56_007963 [Elasticomyces elasticus]|nr:hypothetical protein LTR56_007963 [Elasticomyces elasticus]KAK3649082.1 hypothetical protein LTR22_013052 [Elasticomyces elasticus]KAK5748210.1 hypothetical protein LTS12_021734 [Elasticomyces elasticus]